MGVPVWFLNLVVTVLELWKRGRSAFYARQLARDRFGTRFTPHAVCPDVILVPLEWGAEYRRLLVAWERATWEVVHGDRLPACRARFVVLQEGTTLPPRQLVLSVDEAGVVSLLYDDFESQHTPANRSRAATLAPFLRHIRRRRISIDTIAPRASSAESSAESSESSESSSAESSESSESSSAESSAESGGDDVNIDGISVSSGTARPSEETSPQGSSEMTTGASTAD